MTWSFREWKRNRFLQYFYILIIIIIENSNNKNNLIIIIDAVFLKNSDYNDHNSKSNRPLLPSVKLDIVCLWYRYFSCDNGC